MPAPRDDSRDDARARSRPPGRSPRHGTATGVRVSRTGDCPACGRTVHQVTVRRGEAWLSCAGDKRGCGQHWLALVLPVEPGASATPVDGLLATYGPTVAAALRAACPDVARPVAALALANVDTDPDALVPSARSVRVAERAATKPVVHVQVLVLARLLHAYRYAPLADVLWAADLWPTPPVGAVAHAGQQRKAG